MTDTEIQQQLAAQRDHLMRFARLHLRNEAWAKDAVLDACTEKRPPMQARLFLMRGWLELSSDEICKELGLTATNLYVQLHRACLRLRERLQLNWFASR